MAFILSHRKIPAALCIALACSAPSLGQNAPASPPAGTAAPLTVATAPPAAEPQKPVSPSQAREADNAYIEGARQLEHKDLIAAERSFTRATQLNPANRDYVLALIVTHENRITGLVQAAAQARQGGDIAHADALLAEAQKLDPENRVIAQHFDATDLPVVSDIKPPGNPVGATLGGPIELTPSPGVHTFDVRGNPQSVLTQVYSAFGIKASFDPSVTGPLATFELKDVDFATATRIASQMTHTFAIPIQEKSVLLARDNPENRSTLEPLIEETIYLPGIPAEEMTELANVARNVFDIKQVTASATGGDILVRGDEPTLRILNATYADMLDGGSEVLFDVKIYEIDKTHANNIGLSTPNSANFFSFYTEAEKLVSQNQSAINAVLSTGAIQLTNNPTENIFLEALYLVEYGGVADANISNLLGVLGTYGGIPLFGVAASGTTTFNFGLTASDTRLLDELQLRSSNHQPTSLRVGSRYPVVTSSYSSALSASNLTAAEQALLKQYLGSSTISTANIAPQIQFEDLGITLKLTPQIQHNDSVNVALDMKIESLAGSSINGNPILNNRTLTSNFTVPANHAAMLATLVTTNDLGAINGLPGLGELPGFQDVAADNDIQKSSTELLITITPHIVRSGAMRIASRPLLVPHTTAP